MEVQDHFGAIISWHEDRAGFKTIKFRFGSDTLHEHRADFKSIKLHLIFPQNFMSDNVLAPNLNFTRTSIKNGMPKQEIA